MADAESTQGTGKPVGFGRRGASRDLWIFAHRGDSAHAPENTLEAAERGWIAGADAWEFDVQLTRDGTPIVLHDDSLLRTTDVATRFAGDPRAKRGFLAADFDLAEIRTLDAGSWFVLPNGSSRSAAWFGTLESLPQSERMQFASGDVRIPTLEEALAWTKSKRWRANVELKSFPLADGRRIDRIVGAARESGLNEALVLSSFDHDDLVAIRRRWSDIALGALAVTPFAMPEEYLKRLGATSYHVSREIAGLESLAYLNNTSPDSLRQNFVSDLHACAMAVHVYTVNDLQEAADLEKWGVDGIFTDDPASAVGQRETGRTTVLK